MIRLRDVSKSFDGGRTVAVDGLTLEVQPGETLVLLGSSGCGKTTTLKMINRLLDPSGGTIEVDGVNVRSVDPVSLRRSIGYVFQGIGLFPHLTIGANVGMPLRLARWPATRRRERVAALMELVELPLDDYADRFPDELSGGQQQRVAVARALANDPGTLLMDEPFGALDAVTRDSMQKQMLELNQRLHKTIVFVTHDILEAVTLGDRIAVMHGGRLQQIGGGAELLNHPANDFVGDLFRKAMEKLDTLRDLAE